MRILYAIFILCLLVTPAFAGHVVTLKTTTELTSNSIKLSDVFDGVPKELDRDIAISPNAGQSVTYDVRVLTRLAKQYRLDWQPSSYTDRTLLTRAANYLTLDMIEPVILSEIEKKDERDTSYEIAFDNRSFSLALPASHKPEFKIMNFHYDNRAKRFRAEIIAKTDTNFTSHHISGRVIASKNIPVLSKRVRKGEIIGESDIKLAWVPESQIHKNTILNAKNLIGKEIKQEHNEGSFLTSSNVISPRLVLKGTMVTMKIRTPSMIITAQGRALQDGAKGDMVRIKNMQSHRIIEAVVEADGVVKVQTGSVNQIASM